MSTILDALMQRLEGSQTPCEKHHCRERPFCAIEMKACDSFRYYIDTGRALPPDMYIPLFKTKQDQPHHTGVIEPTHAKYLAMMVSD